MLGNICLLILSVTLRNQKIDSVRLFTSIVIAKINPMPEKNPCHSSCKIPKSHYSYVNGSYVYNV